MKANELMIGDWLYYKGQFNAFPFKVESITKKKVGYHAEPNEHRMYYLRLSECKPIPLTAEILKRNGFEIRQSLIYWNSYRILIDKETNHYLFLEHHFHSDYVKIIWQHASGHDDSMVVVLNHCAIHQLQHALKLCGINKEIIV